jgi:hypothetical protein
VALRLLPAADGTHRAFYASLADLACLPLVERLVCRCAIASSHFGHDRVQTFRCSSAALFGLGRFTLYPAPLRIAGLFLRTLVKGRMRNQRIRKRPRREVEPRRSPLPNISPWGLHRTAIRYVHR